MSRPKPWAWSAHIAKHASAQTKCRAVSYTARYIHAYTRVWRYIRAYTRAWRARLKYPNYACLRIGDVHMHADAKVVMLVTVDTQVEFSLAMYILHKILCMYIELTSAYCMLSEMSPIPQGFAVMRCHLKWQTLL